jgi:transposase InsO family protein
MSLTTTRPNTAWVTDITHVRTWRGWLHLAVVDTYAHVQYLGK